MLNIKLWILAVVCVVLLSNSALADLGISLKEMSPATVAPGNEFFITFAVSNPSSSEASASFELKEKTPFEVQGKKATLQLKPFETKTLTYRVIAASGTASGDYPLKLQYEVENDEFEETFTVRILAIESTLTIDKVELEPKVAAPGQSINIILKVKNLASYALKDISLKLDLTNALLPFAPKDSSTEQKITSLDDGQSKEVVFTLNSLAEAESKIYKLPLKITYYDEFAREYSMSDLVGIELGEKPELSWSVEENSLVLGQPSDLTVKIVNQGLAGVKFLNVEIASNKQAEVIGTTSFYLGNLDSDDFETVELKVLPKASKINLPLTLEYKSANNQEQMQEVNLAVKAYTLEEAKKLGLVKSSSFWMWGVVIVILIGVMWFIRRMRKKKRE